MVDPPYLQKLGLVESTHELLVTRGGPLASCRYWCP
jgi:hypothetical protein